MTALTHNDFATFFRAVWDFDPFPWQEDLVHRLATGQDPRRGYDDDPGIWPDVLDLPTGSGKTAALDIAIFHLALEVSNTNERRAPVRIAFVVDRRLIVDDAFVRARHLSNALAWSLLNDENIKELQKQQPAAAHDISRVRAEPIVKRVALRLRDLAGPDQSPLVVRALRGGAPREDDWARTPMQPTILCSTVDQVGSRLLFHGYGVSDRMKPVHAGLLGSDCLILLDEAHLSEPFRQALEAIEHLRAPDTAPFGFVVLTATPNVEARWPFGLSTKDYSHPTLSARITASKPAHLMEITGRHGVDTEWRRVEVICGEAQAVFSKLKKEIANPAIGVVVNRVARARRVFERLRADLEGEADVILIIGPARSVDRGDLAAELNCIRTRHSDQPRILETALVVVATQTIEAGVDIDLDGLVTEAAALDALKQRFGRVNRAGRADVRSESVILAHKDDIGPKADDRVYGDRIRTTWEKLQQLAADANGVVDFGIDVLRKQINRSEANTLASPIVDAPILLRAYADLWSQTSPIPNADPEVALFLHGPDRSPATVQIVWRADIDELHDLRPATGDKAVRARLIELFKLMPIRAAEAVEVPLRAAKAWLERVDTGGTDFSDVVEREHGPDHEPGAGRRAFRWVGEDSERTGTVRASDLRNGDLVVVPADYGGCDRWGWHPQSRESVVDVADKAAWPYRAGRFAMRVTPALVAKSFPDESTLIVDAVVRDVMRILANHREDRASTLLEALLEVGLPNEMKLNLQRFTSRRLERIFSYNVEGNESLRGVVFVAPRGFDKGGQERAGSKFEHISDAALAAVPATENNELGVASNHPTPLVKHSNDARAWAEDFSIRANLPPDQGADVALAAYFHDFGKSDRRFQSFLAGGDPYGPEAAEPLAKSGQLRLPAGAWERAGLPPDWRHEALSVRLAMAHRKFTQAHDPALVLWLIGTHHGYGRPLFPHADPLDLRNRDVALPSALGAKLVLAAEPGPQSLAFGFEGRDWGQLFEHLKGKYGIWGLARLEAFVRLADHRASEEGASPQTDQPYREAAE